jgi:hypothetical protein
MQHCGPCPTTNNPNSSGDNGAAERAAAAEARRQRDAELEQQRIEADNKRRMEEIANQAKFLHEKQDALSQLKGVSSGNNFDSGLKGVSSPDSGLKGASNADATVALKTLPDVSTEANGVDPQQAPTGLPKSMEAEIPNTPAGDRVRKGFQAIMNHDWNLAHAWFQDALNHDPGNAGIQRLVELAEYTMNRPNNLHPLAAPRSLKADTRPQDATTATVDARLDKPMDPGLARALDDFNQKYSPKHPELQKPMIASPAAQRDKSNDQTKAASSPDPPHQAIKANWKAFFDSLFKTPSKQKVPTSVTGLRD